MRKYLRQGRYSSASMGAIEVANRLVEGQIRTIRGRLGAGAEDRHQRHRSYRSIGFSTRLLIAEPVQSQARRLFAIPRRQRNAIRWEVVEVGGLVHWKVSGLTQQKFEDRLRLGTCFGQAEWSDEHFIAGADGVHEQCQIRTTSIWAAPLELAQGQGIDWYPVGKKAKENAVDRVEVPSQALCAAMVQKHGHSDACRSRFERIWADEDGNSRGGEGCEASQLECNDDGESVGNPHERVWHRQVRVNQTVHQASSASAADTTTSAAADQATAPVQQSSPPTKLYFPCNPSSQKNRLGWGGQDGFLMASRWSARKSTVDEPDEDQEGDESMTLGLWTACTWTWTYVVKWMRSHDIIAMTADMSRPRKKTCSIGKQTCSWIKSCRVRRVARSRILWRSRKVDSDSRLMNERNMYEVVKTAEGAVFPTFMRRGCKTTRWWGETLTGGNTVGHRWGARRYAKYITVDGGKASLHFGENEVRDWLFGFGDIFVAFPDAKIEELVHVRPPRGTCALQGGGGRWKTHAGQRPCDFRVDDVHAQWRLRCHNTGRISLQQVVSKARTHEVW